jgi:hypothetical protein
MNIETFQNDILLQAIEAFQKETHLHIEAKVNATIQRQKRMEACLQIEKKEYYVEIKKTLNPVIAGQIVHQWGNERQKWLLVTPYVNPQLARTLRELHIQFIDTVGNAFIDDLPTLIYIRGNKPEQSEPVRTGKKFGRAALLVVYALLCDKELCDAPYREIAKQADVALGTVAGIINDLKTQGYYVELEDKKRHLVRKKELFEKWVTAYAETLRPKTFIGRYRAPQQDFWQHIDIEQYDAIWGGEVAAYRLTKYLKPEIVTIYAKRPVNRLLLGLKLRQDKNGDIELREPFGKCENIQATATVPPFLVYADLMATGDVRNIETAKQLYADYLQEYFGKN